jgi:hypothetical protein
MALRCVICIGFSWRLPTFNMMRERHQRFPYAHRAFLVLLYHVGRADVHGAALTKHSASGQRTGIVDRRPLSVNTARLYCDRRSDDFEWIGSGRDRHQSSIAQSQPTGVRPVPQRNKTSQLPLGSQQRAAQHQHKLFSGEYRVGARRSRFIDVAWRSPHG